MIKIESLLINNYNIENILKITKHIITIVIKIKTVGSIVGGLGLKSDLEN